MSKEKVDNIVFTVGIPLTREFSGKSRHELVAESVKEFNERKHELDQEGWTNEGRHEPCDTRVLQLSNGVIVSYKVNPDDFSDDFDIKKEYLKAKKHYNNLISSLREAVKENAGKLGDLG